MTEAGVARRAKGQEREQAVVRAAARAITEVGLANVRVADIAARAHIGRGHVTYYFPSKDELLLRALRYSEEQMQAEITAEVMRIADPWKRLRRIIDLALAEGPGDPGWVLWFNVWTQATADRALAGTAGEFEAWWREALVGVIMYGSERGTFVLDHLDEVTLVLSTMIEGLSIRLTLEDARLTRARALDLCLAVARRYLTSASEPCGERYPKAN